MKTPITDTAGGSGATQLIVRKAKARIDAMLSDLSCLWDALLALQTFVLVEPGQPKWPGPSGQDKPLTKDAQSGRLRGVMSRGLGRALWLVKNAKRGGPPPNFQSPLQTGHSGEGGFLRLFRSLVCPCGSYMREPVAELGVQSKGNPCRYRPGGVGEM